MKQELSIVQAYYVAAAGIFCILFVPVCVTVKNIYIPTGFRFQTLGRKYTFNIGGKLLPFAKKLCKLVLKKKKKLQNFANDYL